MEQLTNGIELPRTAAGSTTIVRPQSGQEEQTVDSGVEVSRMEWKWKLGSITPAAIFKRPRKVETVASVPSAVHAFVRSVAKIPRVKCVVVEDGEGRSVHITTFVEQVTDELRKNIYAVEVNTIQENPNHVFDFHVRNANEVSGKPESISGKHYYAIWGELDAERR